MASLCTRSLVFRSALVLCALLCTPLAAVTAVQAQSKALDAQFVRIKYPSKADAGEKMKFTVEMKNTGRNAWTKDFYLGSSSSDNTLFGFPRVRPTKKINPGTTAKFTFTGNAPSSAGYYTLQWRMYDSSRNKFGKSTKSYNIRVRNNSSSSSSSSSYGSTDLAMSMTGPSTAEQNGIIRYTVTVQNNGPYNVQSSFPIQMAVIPALTFRADQSSSGCSLNGLIAKCDVPTLAVGQTHTVTMAFAFAGTCNSQVQVQSFVGNIPQGETNWTNNVSQNVNTTISCSQQQANLSIQGSVQGSSAVPQTFAYTLQVQNAGPSAVSDAQVRLSVPDTFTLVTYTSNTTCQKQGGVVTCSGIHLSANVTQTITVVLQLPTTGYACNAALSTVATVTSSLPDPNASNNTSNTMTANVYCPPVTATPNLFSAKDITPIRARQLLGGQLGDAVLRVNFRAQHDSVEVTHLQLTGTPTDAATPANNTLRSVDRLQLYKPGETDPFATATVSACAAQTAPANTMCADIAAGKFIVNTTADQVLIVRPMMKTDTDGGISGDQFTIGIGTQANAIRAKSVATGVFLNANDGNGTAAGEVFVGTATPAANVAMVSSKNTVVMAKIANMISINMTPNGTSLPTGPVEMGRLRFTAASHINALNGLNTIVLKKIMFNVEVQNAEIDTSNLRANLYTAATQQFTCRALNTQGQVITGLTQQSFLMECTAPANVNAFSQGTSSDMNVEVFVNQPKIAAANPVKVQISLQNFSDSTLNSNFGVNGSHIEWMDTDAGSSKSYQWLEHAETILLGTLFN